MSLNCIFIKDLSKLFVLVDKRTDLLEKILRSAKDIIQKEICYLDCASNKKINENGEEMWLNTKYCS